MTIPSEPQIRRLQFYVTAPYQCSYLPDRLAQSLIAAPHQYIDAPTYDGLIEQGFRRSGKFSYRPHCETCNACIPVRIPVERFVTTRSQRRAIKSNSRLATYILPLGFREEHFALYQAYQIARHDGHAESMNNDDAKDQYRNFLAQSNVESVMVEFRDGDALKMVSVIDIVRNGISAVYTFYDTSDPKASYGTYNVCWQVQWAKALGLEFLYLGYWIKESAKMTYKQNFMPQEALIDGEWIPFKP